jgi:ParB-like chromosome segregation protein Spo0J
MECNISAPLIDTWRLEDLTDHPLQPMFFGDLADHDLDALAEDIRRNGLRESIEVLPDGTVLSGHQRRRALLRIGFEEAEVVVRHDLAGDPAAAERYFLESNQNRRHLSRLAKARVALRLYEIGRGKPRGGLSRFDEGDARDRVGRAVGWSGRTLSRYFRVLRGPIEVQRAFEAGRVSLVVAEQVADLPPATAKSLAAAIAAGGDAKALVAAAVGAVARPPDPHDALPAACRALDRLAAASEFPERLLLRHRDDLARGGEVIRRLLRQARRSA